MLVPDAAGPSGERVKLLDFGIAKLSAERGGEEVTRRGQLMGTATYMSPDTVQVRASVGDQQRIRTLGKIWESTGPIQISRPKQREQRVLGKLWEPPPGLPLWVAQPGLFDQVYSSEEVPRVSAARSCGRPATR